MKLKCEHKITLLSNKLQADTKCWITTKPLMKHTEEEPCALYAGELMTTAQYEDRAESLSAAQKTGRCYAQTLPDGFTIDLRHQGNIARCVLSCIRKKCEHDSARLGICKAQRTINCPLTTLCVHTSLINHTCGAAANLKLVPITLPDALPRLVLTSTRHIFKVVQTLLTYCSSVSAWP